MCRSMLAGGGVARQGRVVMGGVRRDRVRVIGLSPHVPKGLLYASNIDAGQLRVSALGMVRMCHIFESSSRLSRAIWNPSRSHRNT